MGFNCGIVGLPNVGKSTIFNALTKCHVPAENYPFCTTDHNKGIVAVPDKRLDDIAKIFKPERVVPTTIEFVDIAGLVEGAHKGEGLGNKFLGHIRAVDAIAHIVRAFEDENVAHSYGATDPIRDIEVINTELMLSDQEIIENKREKIAHLAKTGNKEAKIEVDLLDKLLDSLNNGILLNKISLSDNEHKIIDELALITTKKMFLVANISEKDIKSPEKSVFGMKEYAKKNGMEIVIICGKIEAELADLELDERKEFLKDYGLQSTGLEQMIKTGYDLLDLITFFTKDGPEVRAWTITNGTKAPQAAGKIHTDFEKKFIRAEVYNYNELMQYGSETELKSHGKIRIEGHDYIVKDGDILHIRSA